MKFVIVLSLGDKAVESIKSEVAGNNNFPDAAVEVTKALFHSTSADNATGYRLYGMYGSDAVAEDHFFYAEKE